MRVEDKGGYWEVDGGTWHITKVGNIGVDYDIFVDKYGYKIDQFPPFLDDLRDSLMEEMNGVLCDV